VKQRFFALALVALVAIAGAAAQDAMEKGPLALDMGAGIYYDEMIRAVDNPFDGLFNVLSNFRGQYYCGAAFRVAKVLNVGAELGLAYITVTDSSTAANSWNFFDLPVNATITLDLGGISARAFAGAFFYGCFGYSNSFTAALDAGIRINLGGLYGEYSYILGLGGATSFQRFGLGYAISLL